MGSYTSPSYLSPHAARQNSSSGLASSLSLGAIVGIAIGGAAVLFISLSFLLVWLARRQDRQRGIDTASRSTSQTSNSSQHDKGDPDRPTSRRLQKKSFQGESTLNDDESEIGGNHSLVPVLPPAYSRSEKYTSLSSQSERGHQASEKQKGLDLYHARKNKSWIDEDAIHGPKVSPPNRTSTSKFSWLGRSLSITKRAGDTWTAGSPTLPRTEQRSLRPDQNPALTYLGNQGPKPPRPAPPPVPLNLQSDPRVSVPGNSTDNVPPSPPKPLSAVVLNPRTRERDSLDAAQQLAGTTRVPSAAKPTHRSKHSVTDSDLSEILRMTAERLQDSTKISGKPPISPSNYDQEAPLPPVPISNTDLTPFSPMKSQKSIVGVAEQGSRAANFQTATHMRQFSQASALSEPDSFVSRRTFSQNEHPTALSSPSRKQQPTELDEQTQPRPEPYLELSFSPSASQRQDRDNGGATVCSNYSQGSEKEDGALNLHDEISKFPFHAGISPRPARLRGSDSTQELLSLIVGSESEKAAQSENPNRTLSKAPRLQFSPQALEDDPFTVETPSQDQMRLSQVFTPIPSDVCVIDPEDIDHELMQRMYPGIQITKPHDTPTPSPKAPKILPPPQFLRPMISSPTLGFEDQFPSPALSEGGFSSLYDGYVSAEEGLLDRNSIRLAPEPTANKQPIKSGGESRFDLSIASSFMNNDKRDDDRQQHRFSTATLHQRAASEASMYSQDQDTVGPLPEPLTTSRHDSTEVADAVAQLRRMNSTVSCISAHSGFSGAVGGADLDTGSPTLPEMRGGGFSPGTKGGGTKNYLALGSPTKVSPLSLKLSRSSAPADTKTAPSASSNSAPSPSGTLSLRAAPPRFRRGPAGANAPGRPPVAAVGAVVADKVDQQRGVGTGAGSGPQRGRKGTYGRKETISAPKLAVVSEQIRGSPENLGVYDQKGFFKDTFI
ncbi:hypothetical protein BX600DRAFT_540752 [Xylariales sp. PMI_506]|nr:hypothetical protein BX600DRAFT_540752 [Xylariales sp. PMI_506]